MERASPNPALAPANAQRRGWRGLRWWIGGLLFASTTINYIDRQTLSVLAPHLKTEYRWTNSDFAWIVISFRIAYMIGQAALGRALDRLGTRRGLSITVLWYSLVAMATSLATGMRSFCAFRFLLGLGESANWPGATKSVSEWFPRRERALAVALFDSGSSIGAAVAPWIVLGLFAIFHSWRPVFVLTGTLGLLWLLVWRRFYHPPETHPLMRDDERAALLADRAVEARVEIAGSTRVRWIDLLKYRQSWGAIASRALTDPVWYFVADWFAIYLVSRGFRLENSLMAFWIPFVAADLGNFAGGGFSSWLVARGWSVGRARRAVVVPTAFGMMLLIPAAFSSSLWAIAALFGLATFSYAAFSTMANTFPADLFADSAVASMSGLGGAFSGLGTILSTCAIGYLADHYGFRPVLMGASVIPLLAMALVLALVRNTRHSGRGIILKI